jgi:formylglycine-generating enzyme required for sulfatase activity
MSTAERKLHVFLCHASQDKPVVQELYQRLCAEEWIEPWLDVRNLLPGQDWRIAIEEAVENADNVIICLSNNSVSKEGYVQKEMRYAQEISLEKPEGTIFLIPLRLDECEVPRGLRFFQWTNYFGEQKEQSHKVLVKSLQIRLEEKIRKEVEEKERLEALERVRLAEEENAIKRAEELARKKAEQNARRKARLQTRKGTEEHERIENRIDHPVIDNSDILNVDRPNKIVLGTFEFVLIPKGKFIMGSVKDDEFSRKNEFPKHELDIPYDYWISRFPTTFFQFSEFTAFNRTKSVIPPGKEDHPVHIETWDEVQRYVAWCNLRFAKDLPSGYLFRLPSEPEWEKAARGIDDRRWPWGNQLEMEKYNSGINGTIPVTAYSPESDSPYGVSDMFGNVSEWTRSLFRHYPYDAYDGREDEALPGDRVVRGGGETICSRGRVQTKFGWFAPVNKYIYLGVRLALVPVTTYYYGIIDEHSYEGPPFRIKFH